MSSPTEQLVGKRFSASIGEPWDFRSDAGDNKLTGTIDAVQFDDRDQPIVLCSVSPFLRSGIRILQVVAINRYMGSQDTLAALRTGQPATMNFIFQESGARVGSDEVLALLNGAGSRNFLIGSMTLEPRVQ